MSRTQLDSAGGLPPTPPSPTSASTGSWHESSKACDNCRIKKIRCDRKTPCFNCRQRNTRCTQSPRVQRPKRQQEPTSAEYIHKIRRLERRLGLDPSPGDATGLEESPHRGVSVDNTTTPIAHIPESPEAPAASSSSSSPPRQPYALDEGTVLPEGLTSFSAHSTRAISLLDTMTFSGPSGQGVYSLETRELVESLRQIVKAIEAPPIPAVIRAKQKPAGFEMPPIQASVAAIRAAQEKKNVAFLFISTLLPSMPLSDVCLRVYFSDDYSDADLIIINAALSYFFDDLPDDLQGGASKEHRRLCQQNLSAAISRLSLHIPPSIEMVMALTLAVVYSIETLKPHQAWTLISAAYQASYALGLHLRPPSNTNEWCDTSNPSGLMFWVVYWLEKTLCLRLGRCSTIPDGEITVMLPGGSPGLVYSRSLIKAAQLAGKLYVKLYGVQALATFRISGMFPVEELSRELATISLKSREDIKAWRHHVTAKAPEWLATVDFLTASDKVLHHSLQTLIHSTVPTRCGPAQSFTKPCIISARQALTSHQACPVVLSGEQSVFLTSYLSWFIFVRPFVPFTVLFCHVIETGDDGGDLRRMKNFADSMRSLVPGSAEAMNRHQRLFQVFHDVARRFVELRTADSGLPTGASGGVLAEGNDEVGFEIDNCLDAMGFSSYFYMSDAGTSDQPSSSGPGGVTTLPIDSAGFGWDPASESGGATLASHLPQWFRVSQQMMGLMDNEHVSF